MAKIAVERKTDLARAGEEAPGPPTALLLAKGDGWAVSEVVCTLGPGDDPFEERHSCASIAIVVAGTFQYRSREGREMMTPGSLLLGSAGQYFECGHEHGTGDRCISFSYAPELFERLTADAGADDAGKGFKMLRLPPIRSLSSLIAAASAGLTGATDPPWDELSIQLAAKAVQFDRGLSPGATAEPGATARVTRVVRMIERHPDASHDLRTLAQEARLSPYHFLRTFHGLTGVTPHQYLLRVRLRRAAIRLSTESTKVVEIALDSGFGDVSNFNRTFRAEFGVSPRMYRTQTQSRILVR